MDEQRDQDAPVIQGFTPINLPFRSGVDPSRKSNDATTLLERPEKKKKPVGKASTAACKPRKRNGTETAKPDSVTVNAPKRLRVRRSRSPNFQVEATSPSFPVQAQGSEPMGICSRTDERQVMSQDEDSVFDEALDSIPIDEMDASRSSRVLIETADNEDFINMTTTESSPAKGVELWSSSQRPQTTSDNPRLNPSVEPKDESIGIYAIDKFSHINDDDSPMSDQEDCFEVDRNGEKQRISNTGDVLTYKDAEALAQDLFADEELDTELLNLSIPSLKRDDGESPPLTQRTPPRSPAEKAPHTQYSSTSGKRVIRVKFIPKRREATAITASKPLSPISIPKTAPHQITFAPDGRPIPVVRPPFPASVLPRSPVTGLSPTTVLRTCLRIGEALNAASISLRNSVDALVELYCRIKYSDREPNGYKQFFEFVDLFNPDRSPVLNGVYAIWKGVELWDFDSRAFLGDKGRGKMARVLGRIKRGEGGKGWEFTVLSIWEATWEDVGVVKGIVCA